MCLCWAVVVTMAGVGGKETTRSTCRGAARKDVHRVDQPPTGTQTVSSNRCIVRRPGHWCALVAATGSVV